MSIRVNSLILSIATFVVLLLLAIFGSSFVLVSPSHPIRFGDQEEIAGRYAITFPIPGLGNCANFTACLTYCEDPVNQTACINYAKSKGFHKEDPVTTGDQKFLDTAKRELGCDSIESCQAFCEQPANLDRCDAFARKHNLGGGHVDDPTKDIKVLDRAKDALGCDSYALCKSFCEQEANRARCSDFAGKTGLRGGEHLVGPGGCTSESTCKAFCSDPANFQVCKGFHDVSGATTFSGPGGCNSPESCRSYCQQNVNECRSFASPGGPPGGYNPQEMCNRTPNCSWSGGNCQCGFYGETKEASQKGGEYAAFCQANPEKCKPGQLGGFESSQQREQFEKYCRENPDRCKPTGTTQTYKGDPATECSKYGCSWTGSTCDCSTKTGYYSYPTPATSCPAGQYVGPGGYCIPSTGGYSYPTPTGGYSYPTPSGGYSYPSPYGGGYSYPSPYGGGYSYPTPSGGYSYPTPSYPSPSYGTPGSYQTPSYGTPSYGTPSYGTPGSYQTPSYGTPSYGTPSYGTPGGVQGVTTQRSLWQIIWDLLTGR